MKNSKIVCFALLAAFIAIAPGCQSNNKKDDGQKKKKVAPPKKAEEQLDLTGVWTRQGEQTVVFDCIDSGQTLELTRRLSDEDAQVIKSYVVELSRRNGQIKGQAVFQYTDEPNTDFKLNWTLTKLGDFEYKVASESFEIVDGKEIRQVTEYVVKIKPKNPPKPKVKPEVKTPEKQEPDTKEPAKTPDDKTMSGDNKPMDKPADMAGKDWAPVIKAAIKKSPDAYAELIAGDASAAKAMNKAMPDLDLDGKLFFSLLLSLQGDSSGLRNLTEMRTRSDLSMVRKLNADRYYQISLASLGLAEGFSPSAEDKISIAKDPKGAKAKEYSEAGRKAKPALVAIDWMKNEDLNQRKIAEVVLFPNQTILNDQFGEFEGAAYFADDPQAQRDAAADEFVVWFNKNVRPKMTR